ncbi:MAG: flavin reductase family protein [Ekhidna sp.]
MHLTRLDIQHLERKKRLNIVNSVSGIKPANLIGTISNAGNTNLAIFSSIFHLGSDPALLGFITRPTGDVPRHSYKNIMENGFFTINQVTTSIIEKAHYTSAKVDRSISEFAKCGLTEEFISDFKAPFVKESNLKLGMKFEEEIPIKINGTILMIGSIEHLIMPDEAVNDKGYINLEQIDAAGISGLNSYYSLSHIESFPYARVNEIPDFNKN